MDSNHTLWDWGIGIVEHELDTFLELFVHGDGGAVAEIACNKLAS